VRREVWFLVNVILAASFASQAVSQSSEHRENAKAPSPDQIWRSLVDGNKRFIDGKPASHDVVSQRRTLQKESTSVSGGSQLLRQPSPAGGSF
jgi:hypothetical protein